MKRDSLQRIRRQLLRLERTPRNTDRSTYQPQFIQSVDHVICKANGAITALSGSVPGTGAAIIYDQSSVGSTLASRGSSVTILNLGGTIAADTFFSAHRGPPNSPVWIADTPQAPASPSSPSAPILPESPVFSFINSTDQIISPSSTATVKFGNSTYIHRYPNDATAFVYSTTNDDLECVAAGLYGQKISVPIGTTDPNNGAIWVEKNTTLISGTKQYTFGTTYGETKIFVFDQVMAAGDKLRVRLTANSFASTSVLGTADFYARWDIRKIRNVS